MIAEISAALASIKTAFDLLKIVQESKKAVSELELQRQLVEIAKALADAEMQIASVYYTNLSSNSEVLYWPL